MILILSKHSLFVLSNGRTPKPFGARHARIWLPLHLYGIFHSHHYGISHMHIGQVLIGLDPFETRVSKT